MSAGEGGLVTRRDVYLIQMGIAAGLALVPEGMFIEPAGIAAAKTTADPGAADPGLVPLSVEQLQPARGSVQEHQPAVLEILGPDVDDGIAALFGPGGIADDHTPDCRLL